MSLQSLSSQLGPRVIDGLAVLRRYFAYHGVWAPGVRLLRQWTIKQKILTVLALIGLPLLPMTAYLVGQQNSAVMLAEQRIGGARAVLAGLALAAELQNQQRALEDGRPVDLAQAGPLLQALAQAQAEARASGMDVASAWEAAEPALRLAASDAVQAPAMRAEALGDAARVLDVLHRAVVDASGITLTRQRLLARRAELGFVSLPQLSVALGRLSTRMFRQPQAVPRDGRPGALPIAFLIDVAGQVDHFADDLNEVDDRLGSLRGIGERDEPPPLVATQALIKLLVEGLRASEPGWDLARLRVAEKAAREELGRVQRLVAVEALAQVEAEREGAQSFRTWLFVGLLVAVMLSLYLLYSFFLVMRGGLRALHEQMKLMAQGDLTLRPRPLGGDEVAATMSAMSTSMERLSDLFASVRSGVGSVSHAAQQIATGNADLRTRNKHASDGLQVVVDAVVRYSEQLDACGRQVDAVVSTVKALRLESARNRKQMDRLRERLAELRANSRGITEAVALIDVVSFRTNILALNASVEASKAGDAGRGFAVVAQEVRSLAMRSAEAARRIGEIVGRSSDDIEHSGALADETGRSIAESDGHVDRIHLAMSDVSTLTRNGEAESTAILEQVRELREATEKNLGLVEQLADASQSLHSQGERLTQKMGQFKLS